MMVREAVEFTDVSLSPNPVSTGSAFIISIGLHDFSHKHWSSFTHSQLETKTHGEMGGIVETVNP